MRRREDWRDGRPASECGGRGSEVKQCGIGTAGGWGGRKSTGPQPPRRRPSYLSDRRPFASEIGERERGGGERGVMYRQGRERAAARKRVRKSVEVKIGWWRTALLSSVVSGRHRRSSFHHLSFSLRILIFLFSNHYQD